MRSIFKKAEMLLSDFRPEHSEFQMEHFIINGQGHIWARYKQALRELAGRHPDIENQISRLSEIRAAFQREKTKWFPRRSVIARLENKYKTARKNFQSKYREYLFFYRAARDLKRQIGQVDACRRRELDAEMWVDRARRMAAIDMISAGGLQRSTVEFITSFPRELRRGILADLRPENRQKLISILD